MIEELERLLSKATPGPWGLESTVFHTFIRSRSEFVVGSQGMGGHGQDSANAAAIVALVNAAPALLAVAKAALLMRESQMCGMDILASSHYDVMLEALDALNASK